MGKIEKNYLKFWLENLTKRNEPVDLRVEGKEGLFLKFILQK